MSQEVHDDSDWICSKCQMKFLDLEIDVAEICPECGGKLDSTLWTAQLEKLNVRRMLEEMSNRIYSPFVKIYDLGFGEYIDGYWYTNKDGY